MKILILSIGVVVAGLLFISLTQQKSEISTYSINYSQIKVFDPVYIGLNQGYFAEEGVTVNLMGETFGGPQALTAAASGDIDAGIAATTAIINARAAGIMVKGILDVQSSFEDAPLMKWYVLNDSNIKQPSDLRHKKIGVNTLGASFHYTSIEYLRKNNISLGDVEFIAIPHGNLEQALRSRQIDVAGMIDPFSEVAQSRGGIRQLFSAYDVLSENQFSMIFMSEKKMSDQPEAVVRFTKAYKRAVDFIESNPDEASKIIANVLDVDSSYIARHRFQSESRVQIDDVAYWLSVMKEQGVKGIDMINSEEVGTNEYNK